MNFLRRLRCRIFGHHYYGAPKPQNPPWILAQPCARCNTVLLSADTDEVKRRLFVQVDENGQETVLP